MIAELMNRPSQGTQPTCSSRDTSRRFIRRRSITPAKPAKNPEQPAGNRQLRSIAQKRKAVDDFHWAHDVGIAAACAIPVPRPSPRAMDGSIARPRPLLALGIRLLTALALATMAMLVKLAGRTRRASGRTDFLAADSHHRADSLPGWR